jgi:glutathione S-transferase
MYILNAWPVSPYSAKVRAYLRFKGIAYEEHAPTSIELLGRIKKAVDWAVMPTVEADGEWLQDTTIIIETLEERHPEPSITPLGSTQRVADLLLELHGDEWLPLLAMHYRWNRPQNKAFAIDEFARYGFPRLPLFVSRVATKSLAKKMQSYLPMLGVTAETRAGVEAFAEALIAHLDAHFATHPFMLGSRPGIGDFAMFGTLWAHLYRDPGSTSLYDDAPNVRAWFERLSNPSGDPGAFLPNDEVPATLDPVFKTLFDEQFVFVRGLIDKVDAYCAEHPEVTRVPRALGTHPFTIGGRSGERKLTTYTHWMAQRPLEAYHGTDGKTAVDRWLGRVGGLEAMREPLRNPQQRRNFKMSLAPRP